MSSLDWMDQKACRPEHVEWFFPNESGYAGTVAMANAVAICMACPVREPCAAFAMENGELYGVFGGLTPEDRARLRKAQGRRPAACGTRAGYLRHYNRGEPYCEPCREANTVWTREQRAERAAS